MHITLFIFKKYFYSSTSFKYKIKQIGIGTIFWYSYQLMYLIFQYLRMSCRSRPMIWNLWFLLSQYSQSITFKCSCKVFWYGFHGASTLQPWTSAMHVPDAECGLQCLGHQNAFYGILCDGQIPYLQVPAGKLAIHQIQSVSLLSHGVLWLAGDLPNGLSPPSV